MSMGENKLLKDCGPRKYDKKKWDEEYDRIFRKPKIVIIDEKEGPEADKAVKELLEKDLNK